FATPEVVAAVRSRVLSRPGCRRHARSTEITYIIATPEAVAGCPLHTTPITAKSERQEPIPCNPCNPCS
ncbi:MAG: hypothetical protein ACI4BC_07235, partial [Muribaculaceae bacterium]